MAEAALRVLLNKERPGQAIITSAGISAVEGYPATDFAAEAVKLWNGSLQDHCSQPLSLEQARAADLILCMTSKHLEAVRYLSDELDYKSYLFKNFPDLSPVGEGVDDPIGGPLDQYNETFLEIGEYLGKHLVKIVERIDEKLNG